MKAKSILLLFSAILILSCKNDKTENSKENATNVNTANSFKVTLNVTVKKEDDFSLFHTEDGTTNFQGNPIWVKVKGSDMPQDVVFELPDDVIPTQLRLDFGMAKDQDAIKIHSFKMSYYGKTFEIPGEKFYIYFDPDLSKTIFDKTTGTVNAVVKDGVRMFPSFYPNTAPLGEEIQKIVK